MRCSIITVNFNNRDGLCETIKSVIGQTYDDYEYIVIDGGSTDGSKAVLEKYTKDIDFWVSEPDRGIYHAMNKGVAHAHGDYCLFINSGDVLYDWETLKSVFTLGCHDDVIVGDVCDASGKIIPTRPSREISMYHLYSVSIPHQAAFIRTNLLRANPYDENLKVASDWKFFLRTVIMDNCSFSYVNVIVAKYDLSGISSTNPELMRTEKQQILSDLLPERILSDYRWMKSSECKTQSLTPQLKIYYTVDKIVFRIARLLLKLRKMVVNH